MPIAVDRYYTREEVLALPEDGNRYELVHGELLVSPSPRRAHQRVVGNVYAQLRAYVRAHGLGEALLSPADLSFGGLADVLVQPDVFVVGAEYGGEQEWAAIRGLMLVVEVLSPTTSRFDRFTKRRLYQEMRVPVYWIVDVEQRRAEVWTPQDATPVVASHQLTWHPAGAAAPLVVQLAELLDG